MGLAIASGTTYAATTALGRPLSQRTDPLALTTVATTAGAIALVPAALIIGGPLTTGDPVALGALAYLGVMTMALAYGLLYAGLRTTSSTAAVIASLLEPVTAAIVAAVFLDERVGVARRPRHRAGARRGGRRRPRAGGRGRSRDRTARGQDVAGLTRPWS